MAPAGRPVFLFFFCDVHRDASFLFKSDDLAGRPFHLQKKETIDGYDKITGKYKDLSRRRGLSWEIGTISLSLMPRIAVVIEGIAVSGAFGLQQTDAQTDPSSYRPYIIRHLLAYVHTVPDGFLYFPVILS